MGNVKFVNIILPVTW